MFGLFVIYTTATNFGISWERERGNRVKCVTHVALHIQED